MRGFVNLLGYEGVSFRRSAESYISTHADRSALLGFPLSTLPCNSFAPGQLGASFLLVLPMPLPQEVARYDGIRAPWKIYCIETAYELYKQYGCERYVEMLHIINEAWKGNVDSYLAGVIRGVARFISVYEGEYSRERLVQQLARTHPKTITQLAQKDTGSSANRHMRQILRIYNGASREMSLPLKN